jgi:hypothetical protein
MSALESPSSRLLVRVGLSLWLAAGLASVWEVLALQPPDSPLHLGVQLSTLSFALGAVHLVLGLGWRALYVANEGKAVVALLVIGALLQVLALFYAASRGLMAVQILDPRADARLALYGRGLGHAFTLAAGVGVLARMLRR